MTSDEEVLEQMLLVTRSYYVNIQAYYYTRESITNRLLDTGSALERLSVCIGLDWIRTMDPAPIQSNKIAGLVVVDL